MIQVLSQKRNLVKTILMKIMAMRWAKLIILKKKKIMTIMFTLLNFHLYVNVQGTAL